MCKTWLSKIKVFVKVLDQQEKVNDKYRTNKELLTNVFAFPTLPGGRDSVLLLLLLN